MTHPIPRPPATRRAAPAAETASPEAVTQLAEQAGLSAAQLADLMAWAELSFPGYADVAAAHELRHLLGARAHGRPYRNIDCPLFTVG